MDLIIVTIFWFAVWLTAGILVGRNRGRELDGALLALFCGPFGVMVLLLLEDRGLRCHACYSKVHRDAHVCAKCGAKLDAASGGYAPLPRL